LSFRMFCFAFSVGGNAECHCQIKGIGRENQSGSVLNPPNLPHDLRTIGGLVLDVMQILVFEALSFSH